MTPRKRALEEEEVVVGGARRRKSDKASGRGWGGEGRMEEAGRVCA